MGAIWCPYCGSDLVVPTIKGEGVRYCQNCTSYFHIEGLQPDTGFYDDVDADIEQDDPDAPDGWYDDDEDGAEGDGDNDQQSPADYHYKYGNEF